MLELKNIQTNTCLRDIEVLDCNIKEHLKPPKNIKAINFGIFRIKRE